MGDNSLIINRQLLVEIAEGSETAYRLLYDRFRPQVYTYLLRITDSKEIAEDTLQDIFLKLWSIRSKLPDIGNVTSYIHRMAHNYAYDSFKRVARETLVLAEIKKAEAFEDMGPGEELISKEVRAHIRDLVNRLTPQQKKVFLLSREGGLKQEEIAQEMNISLFTVKKHMVDALRFLREELGNTYGASAIALFVIYRLGE